MKRMTGAGVQSVLRESSVFVLFDEKDQKERSSRHEGADQEGMVIDARCIP